MKIAYCCADLGIPIRGFKGASVHVRELASALASLGHEVRIFSPNPGEGNSLPSGVSLVAVAVRRSPQALRQFMAKGLWKRTRQLDKDVSELAYNFTLYRRLRELLRPWKPDIIYERYSRFNLAGLALARRLGIPH